MKKKIINIIVTLDYILAMCIAFIYKSKRIANNAILIPAGALNGGFGDDIMTASFINAYKGNIIIVSNVEGEKDYLNNKKIKKIIPSKYYYPFTSILKHMHLTSDIYIIGADILDGVYENNKNRFRIMHLANKMGIKVHLTGFSIRNSPSDYFLREITSISKFVAIRLRDTESLKRACLFLPNIKIEETTDIAFGCPLIKEVLNESLIKWVTQNRKEGRKVIAYCPNTIQANKIGLSNYIEGQARLLDCFINHGCAVLFLYHDLRKYTLNISDKELSKMICYRIQSNKVIFIDGITDGVRIKNYINLSDFTVTGRMHFGISGYTLGKPMFGICYYNKFEGVQQMFDISCKDSLVEYNKSFDPHMIDSFLSNLLQYHSSIKMNLPLVLTKSKRNLC